MKKLIAALLFAVCSSVYAGEKVPNTEIFFDTDKSEIRQSEEKKLHDLAAFMVHHDSVVTLVGNADKRGSRLYNLDLGFRRAESVKAKLVEYGADKDSIIVTTSYGEEKPKSPNDNKPDNLQGNRRTDAITLMVRERVVTQEVTKEVVVEKQLVRRHRVSLLGGISPSGVNKAKKIAPNTFVVKEDFDLEAGVSYSFLTPLFDNRLSVTGAGFTNKSGFIGIGLDF